MDNKNAYSKKRIRSTEPLAESSGSRIVRIQRVEEIAALIPYCLGYAPRNCLIGVSYEREGKLHPALADDSPYMLGPMIRFACSAEDGRLEAKGNSRSLDARHGSDSHTDSDSAHDSCSAENLDREYGSANVGAQALARDNELLTCDQSLKCADIERQLVIFVQNFSVTRMCLLWYCGNCSSGTDVENCAKSVPIADCLNPAHEDGHSEFPFTLGNIARIARNVQSQIESVAVDALATDYREWVWIYGGDAQIHPDSRHPHSFAQLSQAVHGIITHIPMKDFVEVNPAGRSSLYAQSRCTKSYIERAQASYKATHQQRKTPAITMWNNALIALVRAYSTCARAGECLDSHPDKTGKLLAHLAYQSIRDRVILFAVHPQIESVSRLSQRQLVQLMGEASELLPDIQRVHSVLSLLAYISMSAPEKDSCAESTISYLLWWIGEGSEALTWVRTALKKDPQNSLARLVEYALRIQLPPPWVSVCEKTGSDQGKKTGGEE